MKVHLVDGTYELFRSFFGAPKRTATDGAEVGALRGLLHSVLKLLSAEDVTHVAVAFDHVIESFRNDLFDGYKTGAGLPEMLTSQFHPAEDLCRALGLIVWPMVEYEADDALAAAAMRWVDRPEVDQIVLCTPDKDLAQCVRGTRVVLWDRMRQKIIDENGVIAKFGIPPASIPDFLALVGDSADGIPGVPRWGQTSSAALLARYGSLDAIPDDCEHWKVKVRGAKGLANTLTEHRQQADLYRVLATLRTDVPIQESLEDLRWLGAHRAPLERIVNWLRDQRTLERVPRWQ